MNKSANEKIHNYNGWEKESTYKPWQFIGLLPLFDPLPVIDYPINKVDGSTRMFLKCRYEIMKWLDTSMAYQ